MRVFALNCACRQLMGLIGEVFSYFHCLLEIHRFDRRHLTASKALRKRSKQWKCSVDSTISQSSTPNVISSCWMLHLMTAICLFFVEVNAKLSQPDNSFKYLRWHVCLCVAITWVFLGINQKPTSVTEIIYHASGTQSNLYLRSGELCALVCLRDDMPLTSDR